MRLLLTVSAFGALAVPGAAAAQMDWLTPSLENQRHQRIQRHQQKQRAESYQRHRETNRRPITMAERQAAWSRNKAEYRRRMLNDGPASADRWLDELVLAGR